MKKRKPFAKKVLKRIEIIKEAYNIEGSMTLRRCFYILVGKREIKNSKSSYQGLSKLFVKARELNYLGWYIIEDRHRAIIERTTYSNFDKAFDVLCEYYRKNSMLLQDTYVEIWVEKDAISGVVSNLTWDLDVPLIVGKGFSSITYIKEASDRFKEQDKPIIILYISDFDPEGEFFPKKVKEKLDLYGCENVKIKKIILTKSQIKKYKLPSNKDFKIKPEQKKKQYVKDFIKANGEIQIELDALSNIDLSEILESELKKLLDLNLPEKSDRESSEEVEEWKEENLK